MWSQMKLYHKFSLVHSSHTCMHKKQNMEDIGCGTALLSAVCRPQFIVYAHKNECGNWDKSMKIASRCVFHIN